MKSFIPWIGGKGALVPEIIPRFPSDYNRYVEVFGGGASILFSKKKKSNFEVYNDIQSNLVNLFNVVRYKPISFVNALGITQLNTRADFTHLKNLLSGNYEQYRYLESELQTAKDTYHKIEYQKIKELLTTKAEDFDVNRAVNYFYIIRYSYSSGGQSFACRPISLIDVPITIFKASRRLKSVVIENKDFNDLIPHYDRDNTFFYCDPPYYQSENVYGDLFSHNEHQKLFSLLSNIKGKFLLSYNDCEFIRDLYKDYPMLEISRLHNMQQRYNPGSQYKELLIGNYDIHEMILQQNQQLSLWEG